MTRSRRAARPIWPLFVAWIRATILRDSFHKTRDRYLRWAKARRRQPEPFNRPGLEVLTFLELWLATLQSVVEAYERSVKHSDPTPSDRDVAKLLTSNRRKKLRQFRDTVFDSEFQDYRHILAVLRGYKEFIQWAEMLLIVLGVAIAARGPHSR